MKPIIGIFAEVNNEKYTRKLSFVLHANREVLLER